MKMAEPLFFTFIALGSYSSTMTYAGMQGLSFIWELDKEYLMIVI